MELASYFVGLQEEFMSCYEFIELQQLLPYLRLASLLKNDGIKIDMNYTRRFILNFKTLELLDLIETAPIRANWGRHGLTPFNRYLSANPNWDEAAEEHFHYYISQIMLKACKAFANEKLADYFGINIRADDEETLSIIQNFTSEYVDVTFDKIPRHLNSLFEAIDKQYRQNISAVKRVKIAIWGSIIGDETVDTTYKNDIVRYKGAIDDRLVENQVFVDFVRMRYKYPSRDIREIKAFLYFERFVRNCFPNLIRMNLENGFQKILAKDTFSVTLLNLIINNFSWNKFPLALNSLQIFNKEMARYSAEIALELQLENIPIRILLRVIYETLGDHRTDLRLVLAKRLFNAKLLHMGLV